MDINQFVVEHKNSSVKYVMKLWKIAEITIKKTTLVSDGSGNDHHLHLTTNILLMVPLRENCGWFITSYKCIDESLPLEIHVHFMYLFKLI